MTKKTKTSGFAQPADKFLAALRHWRRFLPVGLAFSLPQFLHAEDHVDYRYEFYDEDKSRMQIQTHSVYFEQKFTDAVTANGEFVYDGISGATPTGGYDIAGNPIFTKLEDTRYAANLEFNWHQKNNTLSPGFAYSKESDYESYGISLNDALEFNDKNTTIQFGISHNFDSVRKSDRINWVGKDSTDALIGVTQLLTPRDILSLAFTLGYDSGFLNDPYRIITFNLSGFSYPEIRPGYRNKQVLFTSLTHHFDSLNASLEGSYRFHHDSYGIFSHTIGLTWHQLIGQHLIVEPMFRIYEQSSADFYYLSVNGFFPSDPFPRPAYYSADYRLSKFYSLDYGLEVTGIINDHLRVTAGYHRYEMNGLDNTPSAAYPQANVFTVGLSFSW
jgi:hypothetical protein